MGNEYIYATARIRSQEKKLLKNEQFRIMTETKNMDDVYKILQDAGYGSETKTFNSENYEEILKSAEKELFDEINELCKGNSVFKIFSYPMDYHNIKVLLKAEFLNTEKNSLLLETASIPKSAIIKAVRERDKRDLTEYMAQALDESIDAHARTKDPQLIDLICDRYCCRDMLREAEKSGNTFVIGYVKLLFDTLNVKTYFRVRKMNQPWSYFSDMFIPGGNVDLNIFISGYEEDFKQQAERFAPYEIYDAVNYGGEAYEQTGAFTELEKICDNLLIRYIKGAKAVTFGIEALVAFLVAKQMEIKCIRILMTGKLSNMKSEVIEKRMRETYE